MVQYGLSLPLPLNLALELVRFEGWCVAGLQLDRVGAYVRPVQGSTYGGHLSSIRGYLGFMRSHFELDAATLALSLYQDAHHFITFISFLKVGG